MCGIFGVVSDTDVNMSDIACLAMHARQRGRDASGLMYFKSGRYVVERAGHDIKKLLNTVKSIKSPFIIGHSRLITNGLKDNQPVVGESASVIHNGIIVNDDDLWGDIAVQRKLTIDSEIIVALTENYLANGGSLCGLHQDVFSKFKGVVSSAVLLNKIGKIVLFSNNGSLYFSLKGGALYFASDKCSLLDVGCNEINNIKDEALFFDAPVGNGFDIHDSGCLSHNFIPELILNSSEEQLLEYNPSRIKRCSRCVLPETMPYISFDHEGVCNYCHNYRIRNKPKPKRELLEIVEPYRRDDSPDCIVPFSGGRDSCYGLHLIVKELGLNPITYTYDWGMITDLGRRNISRMCAELGVENIIVAADITQKRANISKNLSAWLRSPSLGMISILTAGDKHFFKYVETVKKQTGISLNLWGVNPLEVTYFKAGFLGVRPDFAEKRVYTHGISKQLNYQFLRFREMLKSPAYFNSSLWDTLSGEYYRSFTEKQDYYHLFDYWRWDEQQINNTLIDDYQWETAIDTNTTWRIGDGTAAFYNYVYFTVAGFTEHDTFRSNQIREGQITRDQALVLLDDENRPRYSNIRWYLDTLGMDFKSVISVVNSMPKIRTDCN